MKAQIELIPLSLPYFTPLYILWKPVVKRKKFYERSIQGCSFL